MQCLMKIIHVLKCFVQYKLYLNKLDNNIHMHNYAHLATGKSTFSILYQNVLCDITNIYIIKNSTVEYIFYTLCYKHY